MVEKSKLPRMNKRRGSGQMDQGFTCKPRFQTCGAPQAGRVHLLTAVVLLKPFQVHLREPPQCTNHHRWGCLQCLWELHAHIGQARVQ
jgi:hypothetical protein